MALALMNERRIGRAKEQKGLACWLTLPVCGLVSIQERGFACLGRDRQAATWAAEPPQARPIRPTGCPARPQVPPLFSLSARLE